MKLNRIAIGSMYDSKRCFLVIAYSIYYIEYNIYRVYLYVYIRNLSSGVMPKALSGTHPSKLHVLIAGCYFYYSIHISSYWSKGVFARNHTSNL